VLVLQSIESSLSKNTEVLSSLNRNSEIQTKTNVLIARELLAQKRRRMDVWTPSKRSKQDQEDFKLKLITFYQRQDPDNSKNLFCQVLNRSYPRAQVRAAHIWPCSAGGDDLQEFNLQKNDLWSARNGLLLCERLQQAFDEKHACFVYDSFKQQLFLRVLNPYIMDEYVTPSTSLRFRDINHWLLHCPSGSLPFRRLLSYHAKRSFENALNFRWIVQNEFDEFRTFYDLSVGSSDPDRNDSEVSSVSSRISPPPVGILAAAGSPSIIGQL
jgi:hypothetical protein